MLSSKPPLPIQGSRETPEMLQECNQSNRTNNVVIYKHFSYNEWNQIKINPKYIPQQPAVDNSNTPRFKRKFEKSSPQLRYTNRMKKVRPKKSTMQKIKENSEFQRKCRPILPARNEKNQAFQPKTSGKVQLNTTNKKFTKKKIRFKNPLKTQFGFKNLN